jgi:hypothetical protein
MKFKKFVVAGIAAASMLGLAASSADASPPGCMSGVCRDPAAPTVPAHSCANFNSKNYFPLQNIDLTGGYLGFLNVRTTISCGLAERIIDQSSERYAGTIWHPFGAWRWLYGGQLGTQAYRDGKPLQFIRDLAAASLNWPQSDSMTTPDPLYQEQDYVTWDQEDLRDCQAITYWARTGNKADIEANAIAVKDCMTTSGNITPAFYRGVKP